MGTLKKNLFMSKHIILYTTLHYSYFLQTLPIYGILSANQSVLGMAREKSKSCLTKLCGKENQEHFSMILVTIQASNIHICIQ